MGAVTHAEGEWERIIDHITIRVKEEISNVPPKKSTDNELEAKI